MPRATRKKPRCYFCERVLEGGPSSASFRTIDHLTPKSRGGSNHPSNLAECCRQCNQTKGAMTEAEFRGWMAAGRPNKTEYIAKLARENPSLSEGTRLRVIVLSGIPR